MIESLDLNLYALNNRSNVAYDFNNIKPIEGAKFYIDKTRTGKSSITETTSGIYRVENTFSFDSPFFGSNFDFLGINIVMNSKSIDDETNIKKSIYNSAVPTLYLGIQTNE
ncbi:hypothetical protein M5C72_07255 [Companilactobacillus allii]|uniref:Uncharacterized protein n=1 Tax=Companilactobacillus allii TaxID=1847728 RepID=A0A1P8Q4Z5_9LACO|nr:hypothetical protein [Companilactobacillus allii]APX72895.1 hypothetical protein BTM29_10170 [Companilactobacillus allii]USQ67683.1 hypothetical protein M5C72_07255 [Companilactobacillus allii]